MSQSIKIRKIGNFWRLNNGNPYIPLRRGSLLFLQGNRILIIYPHLVNMRHYPQHWLACFFLQKINSRSQQGNIPTEFVNNQALYQRSFFLIQQLQSTYQRGQSSSPVNICDKQYRCLQVLGHPHIHNIISLEIDFCWTASSLNNNGIIFLIQPSQSFLNCIKGLQGIAPMIFPSRHIAYRLTHNNYLRSSIACGLQKHRIHIHHRLHASRLCLSHLSPAHFIPISGNIRIQSHILCLERHYLSTFSIKNPAHSCSQNTFAYMGAGSHHHNIICHKSLSLPILSQFFYIDRYTGYGKINLLRSCCQ